MYDYVHLFPATGMYGLKLIYLLSVLPFLTKVQGELQEENRVTYETGDWQENTTIYKGTKILIQNRLPPAPPNNISAILFAKHLPK